MYNLQTTLEDLEGKRRAMIEQESKRLDPEQERNQLLAAVRSDNIEITAMEQEIKDTQSLISRAQDRLKDIETAIITTIIIKKMHKWNCCNVCVVPVCGGESQ